MGKGRREDFSGKKLNINFVGLREYDKKIFEQGISFDNIGDVYSLMEDFSN